MGFAGGNGMSVTIRLERAPDVLQSDLLAVRVRIPLDAIRALTLLPEDYVVSSRGTGAADDEEPE